MRLSCNHYNNVFRDKKYIKNIKFFGQSFAQADYSYFFSIFDEFDILHSNVKLIFYYANHSGKSDDDCARDQMNKIDSLFFHYCKEKTSINDANYWSRKSKEIIHALSFEGRLIVSNLRDKVDGLNAHDYYMYPKLHNAIFRINNIHDLNNDVYFKSLSDEYKDIKNLNKVIDIGKGYFTRDEYKKFMANYHLWKSTKGIGKNKYINIVNRHALNILKRLGEKWSNKVESISVNNNWRVSN